MFAPLWHLTRPSLHPNCLPPELDRCQTNGDYSFKQGVKIMILPNSMQILICDYIFNRTLGNAALPCGLSMLSFSIHINKSLDDSALPFAR